MSSCKGAPYNASLAKEDTASPVTYSITGTVENAGPADAYVVLGQGTDTLKVVGSNKFTFRIPLVPGSRYRVDVLATDNNVLCAVTNGTGIMSDAPIDNVRVYCGVPRTYTWPFDAGTQALYTYDQNLIFSGGTVDTIPADPTPRSIYDNVPVMFGHLYKLDVIPGPSGCSNVFTVTFSPDSVHWYYRTAGFWQLADGTRRQSMSASSITPPLLNDYVNFAGGGAFYVKTFLDPGGSGSCSLDAVNVTYDQDASSVPGVAARLVLSGYGTPRVAGTPGSVTITAYDAFGAVATSYEGTVSLASTDFQADLPPAYTFTAGDAGVVSLPVTLFTVGTQSIAADDRGNLSISGVQMGIIVQPGPVAHLLLTGYPSPQNTEVQGNVVIAAVDAWNNIVSSYTGTVHLTTDDAVAITSPDYTFTSADAGVHALQVTFVTGGTTRSIAAQDTGSPTVYGIQTPIQVNALPVTHFKVHVNPNVLVAGQTANIEIIALDNANNVVIDYAGQVALQSSDSAASLPTPYTFLAANHGDVTLTGAEFVTAGNQNLNVSDTASPSTAGADYNIIVSPNVATRLIASGYPASVIAGQQANITITAYDAYNNIATGYAGSVLLSTSDGNAVVPGSFTFGPSNAGSVSVPVTFETAGLQTINANDANQVQVAAQQSNIVVNPNAAVRLQLSGYASPRLAGVQGNLTLTARDIYNNIVTTYVGTVHLTSSDFAAVLPADTTFAAGNVGTIVVPVTLNTSGNQTLSANDLAHPTISGILPVVVDPSYFSLGGHVTGLLSNTNVTLANGNDVLPVSDGNFTFPTGVAYNSNFAVSLTQPTGQTCAFTSNSNAGVMPNSNDTNVLVTCTTNTYTLGGLISGLLSNTNVTLSDGNDILVHTNGSYTFPTLLAYTQAYSIGLTNPNGQICAFNPNSAGSGTMGAAPVTNANIVCTSSTYPLGGSVSGLVTGNVTLTNTVNSDVISVGNGNYLFDQNVAYAGNYNVVATSPNGLTCAVTNGNAVMAVGGEFNVMVACTAKTYALGGTVAGLLANTNVTLHNGADNITPGNGNFIFPTGVAYNSNFAVSLTQPTGQTCAFTSNSNAGVMPNSNDTNVLVTCTTNTYTLGGLISGLLSNTNVTLSDGNDILVHANGSYTFPTLLAYTQAYSIGLTNPNGQICAFNPNSAGSGTMGAAPVTNANIVCTSSTYPLGGSVSGLVTGNVTLTNTVNSDVISVGNGNYLFDQNVAYAGNYNVVATSPNGLTCAVTNGNAVMAVGGEFNVMVACTAKTYALGGTVAGLLANTNVTLHNGADNITPGNGNFIFPTGVAYNSNFAVSLTQPIGQTCAFTSNSNAGVMPNSNDTNVMVTCTTNTYSLGGLISGLLSNTNVTLSDGNDILVHTNGSYTFPTLLAYTQAYSIGLTNPNGQICAFNPNSAGSGIMGAAPVTNANIVCSSGTYPLGGSVSGLVTGNVTLTNTVNSDVISVGNGNYLFDQNVAYAGNYNVVATSPNGLTCAVTNGNAVMAVGGEFNVMVACTAKTYALGGTVAGLLANTNVTLQNGADNITPGNGNFIFPTGVAYNSNFAVSLTQPIGQTCAFTSNSNAGVMPNSNDTNVLVTCTTNTYSLGGLISGLLSNTNVTLSDGNDILVHTNGSYTFPTLLAYTQAYSIGLTNPNGQICAFNPNSAGSGIMGAAPVTNANIVCSSGTYPLGGSVSGLVTGNVTLTNTVNSDVISVGNGNYLFDQNVAYAGNYNVVAASPNGLTCAVTNGNAVMAVGGEFNVMVACTAKTYALGGTVVGLLANTNVTLQNGADNITPGNGNFTFPTGVAYNSNFAVSLTQPIGQTCAFTSNSNAGVMPNSNDTNVLVTCTTNTYSLGGLISGLLSNTNVTLSDGNDILVHTNGSYTFPTLLAYTQAYSIGLTNPNGQICAFNPNSAGSGPMGAAPVTNANIVCTSGTYPLGGSVSGLVTGNVTLTNTVNSDVISVGNGNYLFDQNVAYAGNYNVVATSPNGLTCAVTNGNAVMAVGGEFNVMVACTAKTYALGGTVVGLLANTNVTLQNGADNITPGNGNFTFPTGVAYNSNFAVSLTQPIGQTCAFTSNSNAGVMPNSNDTNVLVTCTTNTYTLGGLISGLLSNTNVTLSDGNDILVHTNGSYTFPTLLAYTQAYSIGLTNPNGQICAFNPNSAGSGTMGAAPVTNANIVCSSGTYPLGGSVSGLVTGNVTLTNTVNSDVISVGNGNYLFDQNVAYAGNYNVVATSPNGLTCAVTNGNAVMAVGGEFNVMVACTAKTYALGGTVAGLLANTNVTLQNGADNITPGNGNFIFPTGVAYNSNFAVSLTQPIGQTCAFTSNSNAGVMPNSNDTNVLVTCTTNTYSLGGLISGLLSNTNVTLSDGNDILVHTNGSYTFPTLLAYTQAYSIGLTNPNGQICAFNPNSAGSGIMGAAPVTNANIVCASGTYPLGGSVSGLVTGNVTLTNTVNSDVISVGNGNYLFDQNVAYAGNYNVVATSPNGLTCAVTNGNAVMAVGGEFNVMVACTAKTYALGGTVAGLLANTNVTLHNGADNITPGNGNFIFPTGVAYNSNFAVSLTQPTGQTCAFTSNSNAGVMPNSNDTNVLVTCTTNTYSLGGLISGLLSNTNVTLSDGNDILVHTNGSYTFPTLLAYTQAYSIGLTNPNGQICAFNPNSAGSGTMGAAPVTNANIVCSSGTYPLGGSVSGLVTGNVTLTNTVNSDVISVGNGNYLFDQNVAYAGNYNVVATSPNGLTCAVTNGNAVMAVGGEFNVMVACTAKTYALGGTVAGLLANTNVTLHNGADNITPGNGNFTFPTGVAYNSNFAVSLTQPTGQTCAFTSNSNAGVMPNSNDTNVLVTCTTNTYTLGGLISGLLSNTNVTLSDGNDILVHTNGSYTFPTLLAYTQAYSIGLTNPNGQICAFNPNSAGSGTMGAAPVTNANIVCSSGTYPLGGSVSGLVTGNVTLTNTVNSDVISVGNGNYLFDQNVAYAGNYNVVAASPNGLTCAVTNGNAVMAVGGEFNVMVACTAKTYALGGTVVGLLANTNVTLQNGADNITPGNGNFTFPTGVAYNSNFAVSLTQPIGQTCAFTSNSNAGVMPNSNDTNVLVTCTTNTYSLGGLISGLLSNTNVTLSDGNDILVHTNGSYTFPTLLAYTQAYSIGLTNPNGQICAFNPNSAGSGPMGAAPVTNANIVCTSGTYPLGGSVSGLVTGNVTLTNTVNSDVISVGNGNYLFDQNVAYAGNYNVVATSPNGLTCAVTNGNAVMAVGGEFNVMVACTAKTYALGGTVAGLLANTNVTLHNGADNITPGNGNFTFPTGVAYNSNFAVSLTQPTGQTCAFTSNSNAGVMPNSNDTNVLVTCTTNTYTPRRLDLRVAKQHQRDAVRWQRHPGAHQRQLHLSDAASLHPGLQHWPHQPQRPDLRLQSQQRRQWHHGGCAGDQREHRLQLRHLPAGRQRQWPGHRQCHPHQHSQ